MADSFEVEFVSKNWGVLFGIMLKKYVNSYKYYIELMFFFGKT